MTTVNGMVKNTLVKGVDERVDERYFDLFIENFNYSSKDKDSEAIDYSVNNDLKDKLIKIDPSITTRYVKEKMYSKFYNPYNESDITKFISYISNNSANNSTIRIVCHNGIMRDFLEKIVKNSEKYKSISANQNVWSISLKTDKINFIITRHGFSVANYFEAKSKKLKQISETDAKLTLWGIYTALLRATSLNKEQNGNIGNSKQSALYSVNMYNEYLNSFTKVPELARSPTLTFGSRLAPKQETETSIYVSVLIRTWMTAICLYLPFCESDTLILHVSPYLKETGISYDNIPDNFNIQKKIFLYFLQYLWMMSQYVVSWTETNNSVERGKYFRKTDGSLFELTADSPLAIIYENLKSINTFFINKHKVVIIYKYIVVEYKFDNQNGIIMTETHTTENPTTETPITILNITELKIFEGKCKPGAKISEKIFDSCEPFANNKNDDSIKKRCIGNLYAYKKSNAPSVLYNTICKKGGKSQKLLRIPSTALSEFTRKTSIRFASSPFSSKRIKRSSSRKIAKRSSRKRVKQ